MDGNGNMLLNYCTAGSTADVDVMSECVMCHSRSLHGTLLGVHFGSILYANNIAAYRTAGRSLGYCRGCVTAVLKRCGCVQCHKSTAPDLWITPLADQCTYGNAYNASHTAGIFTGASFVTSHSMSCSKAITRLTSCSCGSSGALQVMAKGMYNLNEDMSMYTDAQSMIDMILHEVASMHDVQHNHAPWSCRFMVSMSLTASNISMHQHPHAVMHEPQTSASMSAVYPLTRRWPRLHADSCATICMRAFQLGPNHGYLMNLD